MSYSTIGSHLILPLNIRNRPLNLKYTETLLESLFGRVLRWYSKDGGAAPWSSTSNDNTIAQHRGPEPIWHIVWMVNIDYASIAVTYEALKSSITDYTAILPKCSNIFGAKQWVGSCWRPSDISLYTRWTLEQLWKTNAWFHLSYNHKKQSYVEPHTP